MLDKSVPYASLRMRRRAGTGIPEFPLPDGYRFTMYRDSDDEHWARIETSVLEFDNEFAALMYFKENYAVHKEELCRRLLFIETCDGLKVATANAWWSIIKYPKSFWQKESIPDERRAWLHWISVDPAYQGLGLGKAVVAQAMRIMRDIEGDVDMYLGTQTWSYKAIDIYKKCGFEPTDEKVLYQGKSKGEYKKALRILSKIERK